MAGGQEYKKAMQQTLTKQGPLQTGSLRKFEGGTTSALWVYNLHLPKFSLGKEIAPNMVYNSLLQAFQSASEAKIKSIIVSPTDLISLGYNATKAIQIATQAIFDYCKDENTANFDEFILPIQTLSMAKKTNSLICKIIEKPETVVFKIKEPPISRTNRPDKNITDHQQMIRDLNRSEGFSDLDYDIDPEEIQKMQSKDPYFGLIIDYLKNDQLPINEKLAKKIRKESQNFELISGILYNFWLLPKSTYTEQKARFRLCVPPQLRHRIMYAYHDAPISAHRSTEKMYLSMKLNYYWKGMFSDIQNWTESCIRCSKAKSLPRTRRAKLQPIMESIPLANLNIDLIGVMQTCPEDYKYVLTMVDRATRYCFAVPIKDGSAVTIARAIFSEVITKFGLIDCIVSDRGLNFTSPIVQHLCSLLGTKRIMTSAYRPSSNGLVERFNGVFKQKLLSLVGENPEKWPLYLDAVLYSLRTTIVEPVGYTPYELIFGREPKLLLQIGNDVLKTHPSMSVRRYMAELRSQLNIIHDAARKSEEKQKEIMKTDYDQHSRPFQYQIGDRVWIRSPQLTPGSTRKFRDKYVGPYILENQTSENTFTVRREDTQLISETAIHSDRFKPCISRYVKPEYMPGITDEQIVGPELPEEVCQESDYIKESNDNVSNFEKDTSQTSDSINNQEKDDQVCDQLDPVQDQTYYPVERIIRGKYTPDGIKYLIKWQNFSSKHNSWEKESDLSPETLEELKIKPVRIFGRKPKSLVQELQEVTDMLKTHKLGISGKDQEVQERHDVDLDPEDFDRNSDIEDIQDY